MRLIWCSFLTLFCIAADAGKITKPPKPDTAEDTITHFTKTCKGSPKTTMILIESTIQTLQSNLGPFVRSIHVDEYCDCYISKMVKEIGFDHTARFKSFKPTPPLTAEELFNFGQISEQVTMSCVQDQKSKADVTTTSIPAVPTTVSAAFSGFESFMQSTVRSGKGVGDINIQDSISVALKKLGSSTIKSSSSEDTFFFGPQFSEVEIRASPKNKGSNILGIKVGKSFKGNTDQGIHIGSTKDQVLQAHGKPIYEGPDKIFYKDGTGFGFEDKKVIFISVDDPLFNPTLKTRIEYCDKTKICK